MILPSGNPDGSRSDRFLMISEHGFRGSESQQLLFCPGRGGFFQRRARLSGNTETQVAFGTVQGRMEMGGSESALWRAHPGFSRVGYRMVRGRHSTRCWQCTSKIAALARQASVCGKLPSEIRQRPSSQRKSQMWWRRLSIGRCFLTRTRICPTSALAGRGTAVAQRAPHRSGRAR